MELQFKKSSLPCLDTVFQEVQNQELTQELKLPDGMPDVGRVLSAWGQGILRSKEWRDGLVTLSGGMMVWVLYAPEDGTQVRCIDSWIPFQMRWDLDEELPEGALRICLAPRFVDARGVSARKIMVRCGMGAMVQALSPREAEIYSPEDIPQGLELLRNTYPVRLPTETGEKSFLLEEDLTLPDSAPEPEKLLYYALMPKLSDQKVVGNKLVFRGVGVLHVLYISEEGQLFSWDAELPFSQYADLQSSYSQEAQADVMPCTTALELELDTEGQLHLKCSLVGQYVVDDLQMLEFTQDGYFPGREMTLRCDDLYLPAILETRQESFRGEIGIPGEADIVTDVQLTMDYPRQRRTENGVLLMLSGKVQLLYYGEDRSLHGTNVRYEAQHMVPCDGECQIALQPLAPAVEIQPGSPMAKLTYPIAMTVTGGSPIPMLTAAQLGQPRQPDPQRPSLILQRAGKSGLWDIAKSCDSTMESIRKANHLDTDPAPGQMLLIPITG